MYRDLSFLLSFYLMMMMMMIYIVFTISTAFPNEVQYSKSAFVCCLCSNRNDSLPACGSCSQAFMCFIQLLIIFLNFSLVRKDIKPTLSGFVAVPLLGNVFYRTDICVLKV